MSALPNGWVPVTIAAISESIQYGHTASAVERETGPRFLRITDIQDGQVDWSTVPSCNLTKDELPKYQLKPGDLVFARTGATTGKSFLIRHCPDAVFASYLIRVRVSSEMDERFLALFFQSPDYWRQIEGGKRGVGQPNVNGTILGQVQFSLPPLAEQRRIVGKVEELFSELDEGVANLKQARAQLAVYRQALLKHAFEGHLTADWRTKYAPELESADELLNRIRAEREERYQQQLKEWKLAKTKGHECSKPRELTPWAELSASELADLPPLPAGWTWIPFSNLCQVIRNGISAKPTGDTGDKILRISAVRPMKIDLDDFRYIQGADDEYEDYALEVGDLLFTRYNGSRKFVGVCGHFRGTERRLFPDKLIQGRLGVEAVLPEFVEAAFSCGASRKFVESRIRTTAGQAGVSGGDIKAVPIPVCSLAEQKEIVRFLEESLPDIFALEADIDLNLQKAEALRQSILKKAFAGELVPQDPADEPAAALLARLRAEREAATAQSAKKKPATPRRAKA